ncbi:MAG: hypothetical protein M3290_02360 [Actinomycetota bacterium]|nr:hypothetical protein [Actinomycetota bacterium]
MYQLIEARARADGYEHMVALCDNAEEVVGVLERCPPEPQPATKPPPRTLGRAGPAWRGSTD